MVTPLDRALMKLEESAEFLRQQAELLRVGKVALSGNLLSSDARAKAEEIEDFVARVRAGVIG